MSDEQQRLGVFSEQPFGPLAIFSPTALQLAHLEQLNIAHYALMAKKWLAAGVNKLV